MAGFRNFVIGCVLSAASIMMPVAGVQAMPTPDIGASQKTDVQTVAHRRGHGHYRPHHRPGYQPGYRPHHRPHYRPYYRPGYHYRPYRPYYRPPVYVAPPVIYNGYNRHVRWCLSRYRSYNPATNRFLSNSGAYRVCRSPYR